MNMAENPTTYARMRGLDEGIQEHEKVNVIRFMKEKDRGRYGYLLDVYDVAEGQHYGR
ncbi:hypothetical protein KJY78_01030 [Canibacter sp. lx-45]|uniref:hypothetical protein n=1 Tax=Canibacter zhuwentaonis TaxID=2837491 RepID=UPI001BDD2E8A|nr:hypothetical protein [Canibacter zhuwentaonis]MBT1034938.1 hypothetical protein [Canibacter zhuwentaonis]